MLKRVLSTLMLLALCLFSGLPSAHAFPELAVTAQHACCCVEEVAQSCATADPCCCIVSDSHHSAPSNELPLLQANIDLPLPAASAFSLNLAEESNADASILKDARRKPLHLASNKIYLLHRSLLI